MTCNVYSLVLDWDNFFELNINPFQPSVAFHIETSHLFCKTNAKQMSGFYVKRNTGLKWVDLLLAINFNPINLNFRFLIFSENFFFHLLKISYILCVFLVNSSLSKPEPSLSRETYVSVVLSVVLGKFLVNSLWVYLLSTIQPDLRLPVSAVNVS